MELYNQNDILSLLCVRTIINHSYRCPKKQIKLNVLRFTIIVSKCILVQLKRPCISSFNKQNKIKCQNVKETIV